MRMTETLQQYLADWRTAARRDSDCGWNDACSQVASHVLRHVDDRSDHQSSDRASSDRALELDPPQRIGDLGTLGAYAIETVLGRGGMATVFRAVDLALGRTVAIKMLQPGLMPLQARERIVQEARVVARIKHDHVVAIHAVADPPDGLPYLVMEYLDGPTLAQWIHDNGCPAPREAARLIAEVADGLCAAHRAGVIHRDIKPSNIMLDQDTGRAKLTDFGLARHDALANGLNEQGMLAGTPLYMSPEQARGTEQLDVRTDVYSLGITLRELLTGQAPFQGTTQQVLRQVRHDEPTSPRRLSDAIPGDLEAICLTATAKQAARRYPTAREFADDLRRWLAGEPVRARPAGPAERAWRWCRRKPVFAAMCAALFLSISFGAAGVIWQWRRAEAGWKQARHQEQRATAGHLKAHQAVDRFYTQFSENELVVKAPGLEGVRRQLLEQAQQYYEEFMSESSDDADLARERVRAAGRVARIIAAQGTMPETAAAFRRWVRLAREFAAAHHDDEGPLRDLGIALTLGAYLDRDCDGPEQALVSLAEARRIWETLVAQHPDETWLAARLATNDMLRGGWQIDAGMTGEGRKLMSSGCLAWERLVARDSDNSDYQDSLAAARVNLAQRLLDVDPRQSLGLFVAASAAYRHRIDTNAAPNGAAPVGVHMEETNLALSRLGEALAMSALGQNESALAMFQELCESIDRYRREHPDVIFGKRALAETLVGMGELQLKTGCASQAQASFAQAREFAAALVESDPARHMERTFFAQILDGQGRTEMAFGNNEAAGEFWNRAVAEQQLAVEQAPWLPAYQTDLAKYRSALERIRLGDAALAGQQ